MYACLPQSAIPGADPAKSPPIRRIPRRSFHQFVEQPPQNRVLTPRPALCGRFALVAVPAQGLQVRRVPGVAAAVQRTHMVALETRRPAAHRTSPSVPLEHHAPDPLPPPARQSSEKVVQAHTNPKDLKLGLRSLRVIPFPNASTAADKASMRPR